MTIPPRWVSYWFRGAAIYGIVALTAAYFLPAPAIGALNHYAFIGTALAFQFVFWVIGGDPARYRAIMPMAVLEKLAFGVPAVLLFLDGRGDTATLGAGLFDLLLGAGFFAAWRATRIKSEPTSSAPAL